MNEGSTSSIEEGADRYAASDTPDETRPDAERARVGPPSDRIPRPMSVTALMRRLVDDVATLFRKELALATAEVLHATHDVRSGISSMIGGAAVLYAGFVGLLAAAVLGLAEVMPAWGAALIVGLAAVLLGLGLLRWSKSKMRPRHFAPERTAASLREDQAMLRRQMR